MDKLILILTLISINFCAFAQDEEKRNLYYGNTYFDEENYDDAIAYYQKAIVASPLSFKPHFNMANAYFRKNDFETASSLYSTIVDLAPTAYDKSKVYHNLGNAHLLNQKIDDAIKAYESSLRLNPLDEETRYNLAYALYLKKEQEKQKQENKEQNQDENNQDENGNENESENQNENGDPENQDGNEDKNSEDENNENENSNENDESEENENNKEGNQPAPSKISKEQAKRILDAAYKREKEIQKLIEKNKKVGEGQSSKKDW